MTALFARLRTLSPHEIALLAEATAMLGLASLAIACVPFRRVATLARAPQTPPAGAEPHTIRPVRWAVAAMARRVPWRAKCLEQAFAAQWMLRRRAVAAVIHYGVARSGDELKAHAWVRAGGTDVIGCENSGDFAEVARFPPAA